METTEKPSFIIELEKYRDKKLLGLVTHKAGAEARNDSNLKFIATQPGKILIKISPQIQIITDSFFEDFFEELIKIFYEQLKKETDILALAENNEIIFKRNLEKTIRKKINEKFIFENAGGWNFEKDLDQAINSAIFHCTIDDMCNMKCKKIVATIEQTADKEKYWKSVIEISNITGISISEIEALTRGTRYPGVFEINEHYEMTTSKLYKKYNSFWKRLFS